MKAWSVCAAVVIGLLSVSVSAQVRAELVLTAADVTRITKVSGVKPVPKDPTTGASGDVNFVDASGALLVMMTVQPAREFALIKRIAAGEVPGVGEEAFQAPNAKAAAGMAPYMLVFRKGDYAITITSFFDAQAKPRVPQPQLKELALHVISKM